MKKLFLSLFLFVFTIQLHAQDFVRGADIGWLSEMEDEGRTWRDSNNTEMDLLDILNDYCMNTIRLRVWVNPTNGYSGKLDVINLAKRAKLKGYRIMIDFHYSDSWADPGQQTKPVSWTNYSQQQLEQAVYDHTFEVLSALHTEGVTPEWVQVGNETNDGMLWPEGRASLNGNANMVNYAKFVDRGYEAVKTVFPNCKVVVHVANGYDNGLFRWNIGGLISNGARFDVIGMSFYPEIPSEWETYTNQAYSNMLDMVSSYNKEIIVSEIGLASNTPLEGRKFVEKVIQDLERLPNNKGLGVLWWEPQAYNWKGYGKVAWSSTNFQATETMKGFQYNCIHKTYDCNGVENGQAYLDQCNRCVGGKTLLEPCREVEVTFNIDMKNENTDNGVFITGDFTNNNGAWQIIPMIHKEQQIYTLTHIILSGDTGAYYFLNGNDWGSRELVPFECATSYSTDRTFEALNENVIIENTWQECNQVVTSNNEHVLSDFKVFPNPSVSIFNLKLKGSFKYKILNLNGVTVENGECKNGCQIGTNLTKGTFLMRVTDAENNTLHYKIEKL